MWGELKKKEELDQNAEFNDKINRGVFQKARLSYRQTYPELKPLLNTSGSEYVSGWLTHQTFSTEHESMSHCGDG